MKIMNELDFYSLVSAIRNVKTMANLFLNRTQKTLLKFSKKNVIDSESSSPDSEED